ncbi:acetamidase/formamidase family protein [Streptomyces fuscichromogenes]|uniref:acetamidase/formamidase family protein n=1 Tax=Streptomyces fuscichromogenes TaxID=1324013 RepID=UPI0038113B5F
MCFVHSGTVRDERLVQRASAGSGAGALSDLAAARGSVGGMDVIGSGSPDVTVGPGGATVVDGYGRPLHNRWNRDLPPVATVRPGEVVQLLCRDALDIGEAARTMTPDGTLSIDLGLVHPLTGPVEIQGAEPGDILEVEILDVGPLVDFGYVAISPALGLFGSLRPELSAPLASWSEASQLSDPTPGPAAGALPVDQPYNTGAPFLQTLTFERGQSSGLAAFTGVDTGRRARIPITPFMGILGVAPLHKGMYRTFPPDVSGAMGGNTDIRQLVSGTRVQLPVYVPGAMFSAGDGHMAQGDGEVTGTAVETLMAVTLRFGLRKNTVIASPRAIVPAADPTQLVMPAEMLEQGYYQTVGTGPDLMEDAKTAVREMIDWLVCDQQVSLHEAYALCSVVGDLKINETVDLPKWLVSMTLPRGIFG